jgi:hypothetical protein
MPGFFCPNAGIPHRAILLPGVAKRQETLTLKGIMANMTERVNYGANVSNSLQKDGTAWYKGAVQIAGTDALSGKDGSGVTGGGGVPDVRPLRPHRPPKTRKIATEGAGAVGE